MFGLESIISTSTRDPRLVQHWLSDHERICMRGIPYTFLWGVTEMIEDWFYWHWSVNIEEVGGCERNNAMMNCPGHGVRLGNFKTDHYYGSHGRRLCLFPIAKRGVFFVRSPLWAVALVIELAPRGRPDPPMIKCNFKHFFHLQCTGLCPISLYRFCHIHLSQDMEYRHPSCDDLDIQRFCISSGSIQLNS